jgi:hypothetical protein
MATRRTSDSQLSESCGGRSTGTVPERRTDFIANKAYSLYVRQDHAERAKLLKMVLSNCGIDGLTYIPTYKKPFDLISQMAKTEVWCAQGDDLRRRAFLGDFVTSLALVPRTASD